jgi:molecular chaperone HscB
MCDDDHSLKQEIEKQKAALETKHESLLQELQMHWNEWDALIDSSPEAAPPEQRTAIIGKMVDVLNRRNYIRNLVRDVDAALEA